MNKINDYILLLFCYSVIITALAGCSDMRYYMQSAKGHFDLMNNSQEIAQILTDETLDTGSREKLALVLQVREFSADKLSLSFNDSYTSYVNLNRDYAVKNLFAAPEFSTQLYSWCYPVIGCANYRGYFDEDMLLEDKNALIQQGYETYIAKVNAYSTLGWDNDPVLSSFLEWPEYRLVGLIIHELAHQQIYIEDDTFFNESFAMAVEQAGLERWYANDKNSIQVENYRNNRQRNDAVITLAVQTRSELDKLYQLVIPDKNKRQQKQRIILRFRQMYAQLAMDWKINSDAIFSDEINNATLGMMAAYHKYVPAFLSILKSHDENFPLFYSHVNSIGQLPPEQRQHCLMVWADSSDLKNAEIPNMCTVQAEGSRM